MSEITGVNDSDFARAVAIKDKHAADIMAMPGVVGMGVGQLCGELIIRVFVSGVVVWGAPRELDGIPVFADLFDE